MIHTGRGRKKSAIKIRMEINLKNRSRACNDENNKINGYSESTERLF